MANPVDANKFNFWQSIGKPVVQSLGTAAIIGLGVAGADAIMDALDERKTEKKTKEYYQKMLDMHPQLKEMDPATVAKFWDSLNHYAPYIAQDPLSAGAYLVQTINRTAGDDIAGPSPDIVHTLVEIERKSNSKDKDSKTIRELFRDKAVDTALGNSLKSFSLFGDKNKDKKK